MTAQDEPQTVLVTGAGSGIGFAVAEAFLQRRHNVVLNGRSESKLQRAAQQLGSPEQVAIAPGDMTDATIGDRLVETAVKHFGRLDCAYNNAGISGPPHPVAEMPEDQWRRAIDVMLTGVYLCMKCEIPEILAAGGGAIVNCASGAGLIGFPEQSAYVASKHGVIGLTKAAALEYGSQGIRINSICPGTARTGMVQDVIDESPELEAELLRLHPIGRIADPAEIAEAALWLCTPRSSFVSGTALVVDGGYVAQ